MQTKTLIDLTVPVPALFFSGEVDIQKKSCRIYITMEETIYGAVCVCVWRAPLTLHLRPPPFLPLKKK